MMNTILRDFLDTGVVVYIDDILSYYRNYEEHEELVSAVLKLLQKEELEAEPDKYDFSITRVDFLDYVISTEGVEISQYKANIIAEWARYGSLKDVQTFMEFANFYCGFIENFSVITSPITDTLSCYAKYFKITNKCEEAFQSLKRTFSSAPILRHYNSVLPSIIETDVSDFALRAFLSQRHEGRLYPIVFYSHKFHPAEVNYEGYDKEMLTIVDFLKQGLYYIKGAKHPFIVHTEHKNLEYFMTTKSLNRYQARGVELLANYDFPINFGISSSNDKADSLSRRSDYNPKKVHG